MDTRVLGATVEFIERPFVTPLQLSTGPITTITEARATVTVRAGGREAVGRGSMYLSDLWAWPDPALTHEERDLALRTLCRRIADNLPEYCGDEDHPLELGLRLHHAVCDDERPEAPSILARAMCLSPFDAAIHDGAGIALDRSAFDFYEEPQPFPSADPYFDESACEAIRALLRRPPVLETDAWLIVNKNDSLEDKVAPWIRDRGYRCFKLKVMGRDNEADVARTVEVYRGVRRLGARDPRLTIDSNEANPDAASVLDYLERLREADADAFAALRYVEQPTGRDIRVHRFDWREVARLKPVMLDEGLTSLDMLAEAKAQGWSGLALKTCKGHSFALVAAAWGHREGMRLSLQDLTNPGLAAIHALLFAGYVPTINGVELNSPQFTPEANAEWLPRLAELFDPCDGKQRLRGEVPVGLGSGV